MNKELNFLLYSSLEGSQNVQVVVQDETIWATQKAMAELFGVDIRTINEHLVNIYESGELNEGVTIRNFRIVQNEGGREVSREIKHYNLDVIISVGYRVNSLRATAFRRWATSVLREWKILDGKGKISHKLAMNKAHSEYDEFNKIQKIDSDFEKQLRATGGEK